MDWFDEIKPLGFTMKQAGEAIRSLIRALEECENELDPKFKRIKHFAYNHHKHRVRKKNRKRLERIRNYLYR